MGLLLQKRLEHIEEITDDDNTDRTDRDKRPSNFGFTALRSMISDGSESVVTAIMKESTVPSRAPLKKVPGNWDSTENVCVHRNADDGGEDDAKGIVAAENRLYNTFGNPVVDDRPWCPHRSGYRKDL